MAENSGVLLLSASHDVAIVGMSCAFPGAPDLPAFWRVAESAQSCFSAVPGDRWNHDAFYSANPRESEKTYAKAAGFLHDIRSFAPECFGIPPRRARQMDPQQRLVLNHSRRAIEDAGFAARGLPKTTGVYIGASSCEYRDVAISRLRATQLFGGDLGEPVALDKRQVRDIVGRVAPIQAHTMVGVLVNMIACNVSEAFNLCGPAMAVDAACSSALLAVHEAVLHLRAGLCDAALAGGVYSICTPDMLVGFSRIGALSRSGFCRPFDAAADGFVLGEGVGVVVLKRLEDAWRDGDRIWAVIRGVGLNNDGRGEGPMTPRMEGQLNALECAYRDAGVSPDTVSYIEAHGTATPVGDKTEACAVKENFRRHAEGPVSCAMGSAKGNFGHTLAASGMAGLIRGVLALSNQTVPPQAGLQSARAELDLEDTGLSIASRRTKLESRKSLPRRVGINAFGFGGTNVHLVLEEPAPSPSPRTSMGVSVPAEMLFVISAKKRELLARHLGDLEQMARTTATPLRDIAYTLTATRPREEFQVGFYARHQAEFQARLADGKALVQGCSAETASICFLGDAAAQQLASNADLCAAMKMDPVTAAGLFPGAKTVSLPSAPLPERSFWIVQGPAAESADGSGAEEPAGTAHPDADQTRLVPNAELLALFNQQLAAIRDQMALLSRQAELLGVSSTEALMPASATVSVQSRVASPAGRAADTHSVASAAGAEPLPVTEHAPSTFSAESLIPQLIEMVAQIGSFDAAAISPTQRLGPDLAFDSLMRMDFYVRLTETIPAAKSLPEAALDEEATIAELAQVVAAHLSATPGINGAAEFRSEPKPDSDAVETTDFDRYLVTFDDAPDLHSTATLQLAAERLKAQPIVLLAGSSGIAQALRERLERTAQTVLVADASADLSQWAGCSVVDLTALDDAGPLDAGAARELTLRILEHAKALAQVETLPAALILASAGANGLAVAGVAKALAREWPNTLVRAVELALPLSLEAAANAVFQEIFHTFQAAEVSYRSRRRQTRRFVQETAAGPGLPEGAVVAISGGGRGLGATVAIELARKHRARLLLLGRSSDAPATVSAIEEAGGAALYLRCDIRNPQGVREAFRRGREAFAPIEYVVHAAGVLADGPVASLDPAGAADVLDTKIAGALALWRAAADDPVRSFVIFGSLAGCFGSVSQAAYSAANHALGRLALLTGTERPGTRMVTIDLPPWENSGMVMRMPAAARELLRTRVPFLSESEGLRHVIAEMSAIGPSGEVVLGKALEEISSVDKSTWSFSLREQPWLEDHRVEGRVLLPFAAVLDHAVAAAARLGMGPAIQLASIEMAAPIVVPDTGSAIVSVTASGDLCSAGVDIQIQNSAGRPAFHAVAQPALEPLPLLKQSGPAPAPELSLQRFYAEHTFHGPRMRALLSVHSLDGATASGSVRAALNEPGGIALDILSVDGMLQLCAYWAASQLGRIGLPTGADEFRLLRRPVPGEKLSIIGTLANAQAGDTISADLDLVDADRRACGQLRGLRCRLMAIPAPAARHRAAVPESADRAAGEEPGYWRIESLPEIEALHDRLHMAQAAGLKDPYFPLHEGIANQVSTIAGREFVNFASYNYLGLSGDSEVTAAAIEAVRRYGTSVSASRLASGERPVHRELEREIAEWIGCEDAVAMVSGHATNVSVIGHLLGPKDLVIHDSLAHDSILAGIRLSGAKRLPFPHNDPAALDDILKRVRSSARHVLIAVEGVYSMDGDIARLSEIVAIKRRHRAILFVDEAHSMGVLGRTGRGIGEHCGIHPRDVDLWMGTLSKALASCGGYIAGSAELVRYLKYSNPGFVYSVGLSPANSAAALAALRKLRAHPERVATLRSRSRLFLDLCRANQIDTGLSEGTAVIPCIVGNSVGCLRLSEALAQRCINVQPILHPAVEEQLSRLRFFITSGHTEQQIRDTVEALTEELHRLREPASAQFGRQTRADTPAKA